MLRDRSDLIPTVDDVTDLVQVEGLEGRILYTANVRGDLNLLTALANAGYRIPPRRITVNLAPADVRKEGSALDLPIAVGLLAAASPATCPKRRRPRW